MEKADIPRTLVDLTRGRFKGKVGMAAPLFGTTRGHFAALRSLAGDVAVDAWLEALKANGLRTYDGNAAVVRAVNLGEIDVGLTDFDDVVAGKANGWPIEAAFESQGVAPAMEDIAKFAQLATGMGSIMTPNTVALVKGARHEANARELIDYILSAEVERALAKSESANFPVRPVLALEFPELLAARRTMVDWEKVAER